MRAEVTWQPSMFDGDVDRARVDATFAGLTRIELDERSWVDYCPGWLGGADLVFAELAAEARWSQRRVRMWDREVDEPRLTAGWSAESERGELPAVLTQLCDPLSSRYGVDFDRIWVNLYRDGADSVAWHGDRNRHVMSNPLVATVSVGARRRFLLRKRGTTKATHELHPGEGDLVVMGGACQSEWEHTVPKTAKPVAARMSITIRHSQPAPGERWLKPPESSEPGHAW